MPKCTNAVLLDSQKKKKGVMEYTFSMLDAL
jgi:hypothetical protein